MYRKIVSHDFGSYGVAVLGLPARRRAAFVLADGRAVLCDPAQPDAIETHTTGHRGTVLSAALAAGSASILTGGDDGQLRETDCAGASVMRDDRPGLWRDPVVQDRGAIAVAAGKNIVVLAGDQANVLGPHPSSVSALAFFKSGKKIAAAHYSGISLWYARGRDQKPTVLSWKSAHIALTVSPDDSLLVSATQENTLHGWWLSDGRDFQMAGYPSKVRALRWSSDGRYLCTSGAESLIAWDCAGAGPAGRYPLEIGIGGEGVVAIVAPHPVLPIVALGHESGALALANLDTQQAVVLTSESGSPVSALGWTEDGAFLLAATESGHASVLDFR